MIGQKIEDLIVANIKLYHLCNTKADMAAKPEDYSKEDMVKVMKQDISLCKRRGKLKSEIDKILLGNKAIEEIKNYGS